MVKNCDSKIFIIASFVTKSSVTFLLGELSLKGNEVFFVK